MTYSIVARDGATGELGVAVQSHWFSVGGVVTWARAGVGAVATQAAAEIAYGPRLLDLIAAGEAPAGALNGLLGADPAADSRQVAVVDARSEVAVHTGAACMAHASHRTGDGVSCQANIMARAGVPEAMLDAFGGSEGLPLPERLLRALEAAERVGGDLRGRQSAALLVVPAGGEPWERVAELRVEDHREPLEELRRLVVLHAAYAIAGEADELAALGRHSDAAALYLRAAELAPGSDELRFWAGLGAAQAGDIESALDHVRAAIAAQPSWRELLARLPPELAPAAPAVRAALGD